MKLLEKKFRVLASFLAGIFLMAFGTAYGQGQNPTQAPPQTAPQQQQQVKEDFSDDEIKTFIKANERIVQVQQEGEQEMMQAIEAEDIEIERFNEILMSRQNPDQETDATPEELAAFSKAAEKIMEVQQKLEQKAMKAVEEEGMAIEDYQQIMMAYQQSPKVQQQVDKIMKEEYPQQQQEDQNN